MLITISQLPVGCGTLDESFVSVLLIAAEVHAQVHAAAACPLGRRQYWQVGWKATGSSGRHWDVRVTVGVRLPRQHCHIRVTVGLQVSVSLGLRIGVSCRK
jgi:hypothetical protein